MVRRLLRDHDGHDLRDSLTRQGYSKAVEAVVAANAPKFTGVVPADLVGG